MKKSIIALASCAILFTASPSAQAYRNDAGVAAATGFIGGLVSGLLLNGGGVPVYRPAPVVIERYPARRVVIERRGPGRKAYYSRGGRHDCGHHHHRHHRRYDH